MLLIPVEVGEVVVDDVELVVPPRLRETHKRPEQLLVGPGFDDEVVVVNTLAGLVVLLPVVDMEVPDVERVPVDVTVVVVSELLTVDVKTVELPPLPLRSVVPMETLIQASPIHEEGPDVDTDTLDVGVASVVPTPALTLRQRTPLHDEVCEDVTVASVVGTLKMPEGVVWVGRDRTVVVKVLN